MFLRDIITCDGIVSKQSKPVGTAVPLTLLPGRAYKRSKHFFIDDEEIGKAFSAYHNELLGQTDCGEIPIYLFSFRDAFVFGQGAVIIGEKHLLLDSAIEFINHNIAPDGATREGERLELVPTSTERMFKGTSVLVKRPWYRNFGHWLVDLMPILPLLRDARVDVDRIIFGAVPSGPLLTLMERTARTFFPGAELIFADDIEHIRCDRLLYVKPVHVPPLFKHPLAIQRTVEAAKMMYPRRGSERRPKRIYVSRQKLRARTISNHETFTALLQRHGFETIFPEDLKFDEQISIFEDADVLVGVKGAALTNAIFCCPGSHVLALSPSDFIDPFFWDLVSPRGVRYSEIFCKVTGEAANPSHASFEVSQESIERFLALI